MRIMIFELKDYQREAVAELKDYFELAFKRGTKKEIVFKAPTGSGKTLMASTLFDILARENQDANFCVLWCCPGKGDLQKQSYDAVKSYVGGDPACTLLEQDFFGSRKYIDDKEIVFVNWEKLIQKDRETGEWANNLMKDQEGMNFIEVLDQTKRNGSKLILVIDESHIGSSQKTRIKEFKDTIIIPDLTLEMSATPLSSHVDVEIDPQKVIDEGMIKENVIVNEGISSEDKSISEEDSELLILRLGEAKRKAIVERYKELGVNVNPLVLVQIPNKDEGEAKKLVIQDFLRNIGITTDNGKLKLWCDGAAVFDKKAIRKSDDITEYLIFKTAVATGWDCPRAHILVKFRDGNSETFEIQTIGRILRTAEAKSYGDELLDNAYMFTNIWRFETKADTYNPNRIKTAFAEMRKPYNKLSIWGQTKLRSFYRSRQGNYNSADSRFDAFFMRSFMKRFSLVDSDKELLNGALAERLKEHGLNLSLDANDLIMTEQQVGSQTADTEQSISGDVAKVQMSKSDVQATYYQLINDNLNGLAYVRSRSPINSAIMNAFGTFYNVFPRNQKVECIMKIVVNNREIFAEILSEATRDFRDMLVEELKRKNPGDEYDFKIDTSRAYSTETHTPLSGMIKSLYQPLYVLKNDDENPDNKLEKDFLDYLDSKNEVNWYWENGPELMRINFGIPYNSGMNTFQPDFIVKFSDGSVGIFDTKPAGFRIEDTTAKANALEEYLRKINFNRGYDPKVIGGIVIKDGTQFYVYLKHAYHDYQDSHEGWINFEELLRTIKTETDVQRYPQDHGE